MTALEALIPEFISLLKKDKEIIETLQGSLNFYEKRCELLQQVQKYMRDPERTIVCDILANNALLPDPGGERYGLDLKQEIGELEMTYTFQQVFGVVKTHATERLVEHDEKVPNEGSYNTIIENAMMRLFDDIQEEVRDYNELMNDAEPNLTLELITTGMTMDELFNIITQIIARPDTEITEEHKRKAIQILCGIEDYLIDAMPGYCAEDCEVDFGNYLGKVLDAMEGK